MADTNLTKTLIDGFPVFLKKNGVNNLMSLQKEFSDYIFAFPRIKALSIPRNGKTFLFKNIEQYLKEVFKNAKFYLKDMDNPFLKKEQKNELKNYYEINNYIAV
jgi:hypothetical protein